MSKIKIFVTGTRGIPNIPGGVEKHCEELYSRIASKGHEVYLSTRKPYVTAPVSVWKNVNLIHTYAPSKKSFEAILHTFLSLLKAKKYNPDIVHIHAVGPSLLVPFAKLLGYKVVVTNHGPDYERDKWGNIARLILRFGEYLGCKFSDENIAISKTIQEIIKKRCKRDSNLIYNGVNIPVKDEGVEFLEKYGLEPGKYILAVARLVPEKGLHLLIEAFNNINKEGYKLVVAGDSDHETEYSLKLKRSMSENENIVGTGYITGRELNQIYSNASLFVLPSFHEGLPIALLEAMSYDLNVLVSDIPANMEVGLDKSSYFKCGDIDDLKKKILQALQSTERKNFIGLIRKKYNWDKLADQTVSVYNQLK